MKKRKYALTLLEIMVVISLITIILGVLGYNMKNVLNKGKKFRTEQAIERIKSLFELEMAEGTSMKEVVKTHVNILKKSGFGRKDDDILKDAWGEDFSVVIKNGEIEVTSKTLESMKEKK